MLPRSSPGLTVRRVDYRFNNPFTARFINVDKAVVVLNGMEQRLPHGHATGWDLSVMLNDFMWYNYYRIQHRAVLNNWGDKDYVSYSEVELEEM